MPKLFSVVSGCVSTFLSTPWYARMISVPSVRLRRTVLILERSVRRRTRVNNGSISKSSRHSVHGQAKFTKMEDRDVWEAFCKPLKSGAPYMTEFCDKKDDRRGIGANRWIMSLLTFWKYQVSVVGKQHNNLILKPEVCKELYAEIEKVLSSLEYRLAPKKLRRLLVLAICAARYLRL